MATALERRARRNHEPATSSLVIRNVVVGGHRTSVRLEPVMWEALRDISMRRKATIHDLVTEIDRERTASTLTAAIRSAAQGRCPDLISSVAGVDVHENGCLRFKFRRNDGSL
jgi:predicted DNA-binding ribbon-helix-helix protein